MLKLLKHVKLIFQCELLMETEGLSDMNIGTKPKPSGIFFFFFYQEGAIRYDGNIILYYVSIIPARSGSVPIFISDRSSVSIEIYFFPGLERSDSESDRTRIG